MSGDLSELFLCHQESRPDPALSLVAAMPAFHILANLLHDRERRFDHVGAGQRFSQLHGDVKPVHGQGLFHSFAQAPRRTGIEVHQFAVECVQRLLGSGVVFQSIGRVEPFSHRRFLFVGQMIQHIAALMDLAPLDRRRLAGVLFHCGSQCLAAIQNIESRLG